MSYSLEDKRRAEEYSEKEVPDWRRSGSYELSPSQLCEKLEQAYSAACSEKNEEMENLKKEVKFLRELINTPEIENFIEGLKIEAAHQTEKWGRENEETKAPHDYALVMDKLKGKQALAIWDRDATKYAHHLITMAAVCHNAHRQLNKSGTTINLWFGKE